MVVPRSLCHIGVFEAPLKRMIGFLCSQDLWTDVFGPVPHTRGVDRVMWWRHVIATTPPSIKKLKKKQIAAVAIVGKCVVLMVAGIQGCVVAVLWQ
jgi:hypothetical protein